MFNVVYAMVGCIQPDISPATPYHMIMWDAFRLCDMLLKMCALQSSSLLQYQFIYSLNINLLKWGLDSLVGKSSAS